MLKKIRRIHRRQSQQAHQNAIRKHLEHRLSVAKTQGNQALIRQLKAEAQSLHLELELI